MAPHSSNSYTMARTSRLSSCCSVAACQKIYRVDQPFRSNCTRPTIEVAQSAAEILATILRPCWRMGNSEVLKLRIWLRKVIRYEDFIRRRRFVRRRRFIRGIPRLHAGTTYAVEVCRDPTRKVMCLLSWLLRWQCNVSNP
jgi:hypothetical protein